MTMKPLLILVLLFTLLASSSSFSHPRFERRLEQEEQEQYNNGEEYENWEGDENYSEEGGDEDSNFFNRAMDRLDEDVLGMWNTSPSMWVDEYWEVLGVVFAIMFGVFLYLCTMCCLVHCYMEDKPIQTATTAPKKSTMADRGSAAKSLRDPLKPAEEAPAEPTAEAAATAQPEADGVMNSDEGTKRGRKRSKSLWKEVVNVWLEFFEESLFGTDVEAKNVKNDQYRIHTGDEEPRARSSPRKYKAPSPRKSKRSHSSTPSAKPGGEIV